MSLWWRRREDGQVEMGTPKGGVVLCARGAVEVSAEEQEILWVFDAWLRRQAGPGNALDRYGDGGTIT